MDDLTQILGEIGEGPNSHELSKRLFELVYDELRFLAKRKLRSEARGHTFSATDLVHEVWLRLVNSLNAHGGARATWDNRRHFFCIAAEAMRRILIDKARSKQRLKRGGPHAERQEFNQVTLATNPIEDDVLDLNEALGELEDIDPTKAQIVKLKFFLRLTTIEIAETTNLSVATVERYWVYARAWLHRRMTEKEQNG